jgi:hypothetical protein
VVSALKGGSTGNSTTQTGTPAISDVTGQLAEVGHHTDEVGWFVGQRVEERVRQERAHAVGTSIDSIVREG